MVFSPYNTFPDIGLMVFNILNTVLLIKAIQKLNVLCRACSSLKESKSVVRTTLTLFTLQNVSLILCVSFQYIYLKQNARDFHSAAMIIHQFEFVCLVGLLLFIVMVIIELSKGQPKNYTTQEGRELNFVAKIRTDEALKQYLKQGHTHQSLRDIQDAFKVYEELAAKYQDEELLRSQRLDSDNFDIQVFQKLINQVASETMQQQFQSKSKFDHISMNSHFSSNLDNLDDLDDANSVDLQCSS